MNANDIVFSPVDVANLTETYLAERMMASRSGGLQVGMPFYVSTLDYAKNPGKPETLLPAQDGDLVSIIARPGNGKTSLMMYIARQRAAEIRARAAIGDADAAQRVVVYVTWEQTVEALHSFHIAANNADSGLSVTNMAAGDITDAQWEGIRRANVLRTADPLWFVGHSIQRKASRPRIDTSTLEAALWQIEAWRGEQNKFRVDAVFVDYLQRIPYKNAESKTIGVSDNLDRLKDIALSLGTKIIVGVQAKADVDNRDDPTPEMQDGQWTSNIEQASDLILTLVRPSKYKNEGESFAGIDVTGKNQMVIRVAKQKMGASRFRTLVNFDPRYNALEVLSERRVQF